jgi:predicted nucleic acid-binding Zn ribbon protein
MKKASDILRGLLTDKQAAAAGEWSSFFSGWQKIAGTDIAAHSRVNDVKRGVVVIEVDHPGWLQILQLKKEKILQTMQRNYPELGIENIRIFVGNSKPRGQSESEKERMISSKTYTTAERRAVENTPEYRKFKAMLKRLRGTEKDT